MSQQLYKLTDPAGRPVHGGSGRWDLPNGKPGKWRSVKGKLVPCVRGLHLLREQDIRRWLRAGVLWEVEAGDERIVHDDDKIVVRKARLVRQAAVIDDTTLRLLAADFAEHVLPIFEKRHPHDDRPRKAIEAARAFARGDIDIDELRQKRASAASAAAEAAYAAYAASASAASAASAASDAEAAYAASAAAEAAYAAYTASAQQERDWQTNRVIEVLGLTDKETD